MQKREGQPPLPTTSEDGAVDADEVDRDPAQTRHGVRCDLKAEILDLRKVEPFSYGRLMYL